MWWDVWTIVRRWWGIRHVRHRWHARNLMAWAAMWGLPPAASDLEFLGRIWDGTEPRWW